LPERTTSPFDHPIGLWDPVSVRMVRRMRACPFAGNPRRPSVYLSCLIKVSVVYIVKRTFD